VQSLRVGLDLMVRRHEGCVRRTRRPATTDRCSGSTRRARSRWCVHEARDLAPAELAALIHECTSADFDLDRDWPVRACIVTEGSVPKRMVVGGPPHGDGRLEHADVQREADELQESLLRGRPVALPRSAATRSTWPGYEASPPALEIRDRAGDTGRTPSATYPRTCSATAAPNYRPPRATAFSASLSSRGR